MPRNTGTIPGMAKGKRVRVRLFNGFDSAAHDPPHWPADTLRWSLSSPPHPSDIKFWKVAE
ncbi:hypothetical protein UFOVP152_51 [uncultured Caudovirales phage]|uniref:Uncharacterized protein n=1 Tax=uncultured Caudovirales phage TaxID=2100421 RepID=A0A6J7WBV3_9CAUD|nr:hypothetical protein UFOVP152_51 [uncultured Caudovirales phage]